MKPREAARTVTENWNVVFRHSAGRLGSHFLRALAERRIVGWRTGMPARVLVPPKDMGQAGEWVDVGPGATLLAYAPPAWVPGAAGDAAAGDAAAGDAAARDAATGDPSDCLALVRVDGADTAMLARLRTRGPLAALPADARLAVRFAAEPKGTIADLWFEPAEASC